MLCSSEFQIMEYFSVMLCQNIVPQNKMKISKKFNDFVTLKILIQAYNFIVKGITRSANIFGK